MLSARRFRTECEIFGDGEQTRSFCYVDDTVSGLMKLMELNEDPGPVNIGNPREMTIREVAEMIAKLTGSPADIQSRPLPGDDPKRRCPDISKAKRLLDWEPQVRMEDGRVKVIEYMRAVLAADSVRS